MTLERSSIPVTANPTLEITLHEKLRRRAERAGSLGELEALAVRLALVRGTAQPRFESPQLVVMAADHGIAVEGIGAGARHSTAQVVASLLNGELPLSAFAERSALALTIVDSGVAAGVSAHPRLLARKIAHGTRNARVGAAMSVDAARAALRAGLEIAEALPGDAVACAGIGVGAYESAALIFARLSNAKLRDLVSPAPGMRQDQLAGALMVLQAATVRHRELTDPVEVLAAVGGFEVAMLAGLMLGSAAKRRLIIADGLPAYAALLVASRIAPAVADYAVFSRSQTRTGLNVALAEFGSTALLELGLDTVDGTGATLAWPLLASAAALLSNVADGDDGMTSPPGPDSAWQDSRQREPR